MKISHFQKRILFGIMFFVQGLYLTIRGGLYPERRTTQFFIGITMLIVGVVLIFWDIIREYRLKRKEKVMKVMYPKIKEKREIY